MTFDQALAGTFSDIISGTGSVTKNGAGTLTLSGNNTYTGGTTVNAGTLLVNGSISGSLNLLSGSTLRGTGSVGASNISGTIAPGNSIGTLTINGSYTQSAGSTYEVELNDGGSTPGIHNDLIDVTGAPGTATINGGTVDVQAAPGLYTPGTRYTILQATGGVGGTGYTSIIDNLLHRDFVIIYLANSIQLEVIRVDPTFLDATLNPNESAVALALDELLTYATGDMGNVLDSLVVLPVAEQKDAFLHFAGDAHPTSGMLGIQNTSQLVQVLGQQLRSVARASATGSSGDRVAPVAVTEASTVQLVSYEQPVDSIPEPMTITPNWHGWITGYGYGGTAGGDGNVAGLSHSGGGTLLGLHQAVDEYVSFGIYVGYGSSSALVRQPHQTISVDGMQLGAYVLNEVGAHYCLLVGGFAYDQYDTARTILFGNNQRVAYGSRDGHQALVYLEKGQMVELGQALLQPFVGLQYIYLGQEEFTETGAGALNLRVDDLDQHSLRALLGGRFSWPLTARNSWQLITEFHAHWMHEFLETNDIVTNRFNVPAAPAFGVQGLDLGRDWAVVGGTLAYQRLEHMRLEADYTVQINSRQTVHTGSGRLTMAW